ncbi:MAG: hypothetical protein J6J31_08325, partial [Thermoguttaceae bacterium]|nr:hypothetical protein [Thermoguttaceae bacterium]
WLPVMSSTLVREEHFENRSSLRLPLQKLFDVSVSVCFCGSSVFSAVEIFGASGPTRDFTLREKSGCPSCHQRS